MIEDKEREKWKGKSKESVCACVCDEEKEKQEKEKEEDKERRSGAKSTSRRKQWLQRQHGVMDVVEHIPVTDLFQVSLEFFVSDR